MIRNSDSESISYRTYEKLCLSNPQTLRLVSSDWKIFQVPQVLFSFLSRYCEDDHDVVLTPVHSEHLAALVNVIQPRDVSGEREEISQDVLTGAELLGIETSTLESVLTARRSVMDSRGDLREQVEERKIIGENVRRSLITMEEYVHPDDIHPNETDVNDKDLEEGEIKIEDDLNVKDELSKKKDTEVLSMRDGTEPDIAYEVVENEDDDEDENSTGEFDSKGNRILQWKRKEKSSDCERKPRREILARECKYCGEKFSDGKSHTFSNHLYRHQIREQSCECGLQFRSFKERERHVRTVHWGHVLCHKCKLICKSHQSLRHNLDTVHGKSLSCSICDYITDTGHKLKKHMMRKHVPSVTKPPAETSTKLSCIPCDKVFSTSQEKWRHNKSVHNPQICNICGKTFKKLKRHMEVVHCDDSQKRFLYPDCGKGCVDSSTLKSHQMNVHIKARPYKCRYPECTRREPGYNDLGNRNSHEKKVHGGLYNKQLSVAV